MQHCHYIFFSPGEESGSALFYTCTIGRAILGWGSAIYGDYKSGANYTLSPEVVNFTLTKQEGKPQPDLILLDARQFQNIKWLRIRCARSEGEENSE